MAVPLGRRTRLTMRTRATIATTAALAIGVLGVPAGFADGGAKTRIEIARLTATQIKGTIESGKASCEKGRHVQIFRYDGFLSIKVGRVDARSNGDWKLTKPLQPARYFAKVDSKPDCRYDVSSEKRLR